MPRAQEWIAALHGFLMSATRLGGLPVAYCPLLAQMLVEVAPAGLAAATTVRVRDTRRAPRRS